MKLEIIIGGNYPLKGKCFSRDSIACHLRSGEIIVASPKQVKYAHSMGVWLYMPKKEKWVCGTMDNEYTQAIHAFWLKNRKPVERNAKGKRINYASMMRHDRVHKGGGGGSRDFVGVMTDYECSSRPLHDFRRVYN